MSQDELYAQAVADFGPALERLARSYEADPDKRRDLLQEIHLAMWRSFGQFQHQCSLRTWVYRVGHNAGATHVVRGRRSKSGSFVSLDEVANVPAPRESNAAADRRDTLDRIYALIQLLKPLDREVILLYLEGTDAASIGEITGLSPGNVATKIHRIKTVLASRFNEGGRDDR
ncbi:MAG TPA: sigma-70 family RNA polymerase sigma factor [Vicinamibacterales bacterium]